MIEGGGLRAAGQGGKEGGARREEGGGVTICSSGALFCVSLLSALDL